MSFTRTKGGLTEKWRFHKVPTVWVEGPTDILFYDPIIDGVPCRFEPFYGKENARALVSALKEYNYPYIVILDGDYLILKRIRNSHRHVITLPRYSFENLLWEPDAINRACLRYARCGEEKDLVKSPMISATNTLVNELFDAIILDIAAQRMNPAPDVLPKKIEPLLNKNITINKDQLKKIVTEAQNKVDSSHLEMATNDVNKFLQKRSILHLISGHLLFGLLRRIFVHAADKERGSKSIASDDALIQIFSDAIWRFCKNGDHSNLRRTLRSKLKIISKEFLR